MADNTIAFSVKIDGMDREIKSLSDLKKAKQDATAAFLKGDKDAAKALADLKDKTEDLADATQTLKGSGVEKLNSSFSQLADGFKNFDTDKIKTGFKGIASAMSAIPILLIVEGIKYLIQNFEELSQGSGVLAKILTVVGQALNGVKESLYAVTDAIGATNHQLDLMGDLINENIIKFKELTDQTVHNYDRQIAVARAAGQETIDIEIAKQKQIIFTNSIIIKQIEAYVRAGGQLNDEKKKQLTAALETNKDALAQIKVIEIGHTKDLNKENEQRLADHKKLLADKQKANDDYAALQAQRTADALAMLEVQNQKDLAKAEADKQQEITDYENRKLLDIQVQEEKDKRDADARAKKRKQDEEDLANAKRLKQDEQDFAFNVTNKSIQAAQSLTDAYFAYKLNGVKKGSAEELKIAKQQFETNKKLQLAQATIQGIQSVLAAFSSGSAIPVIGAVAGPAYAVLAGITAAANIAKIASTKFDGGGLGATTTSGSTSLPNVPAPPTINTPGANTSSATTFDENGQRIGGNETERVMNPTINVKATVVETEMTETQKRVSALETQSKF